MWRLKTEGRRQSPESSDVAHAAALLETTEFELFQIAYRRWFGHDCSAEQIEQTYFVPYMFKQDVPTWVRHFAQEVVAEDQAKRLDPRRYGIEPKTFSKHKFALGIRYSLWLVIVLGMFLTMVLAYQELAPWAGNCHLPPCY